MRRRKLLIGTGSLVASRVLFRKAFAQGSPLAPINVPAFAEELGRPREISTVFADVLFIHTWRVDVAPRGYENKSNWSGLAAENREHVRRVIDKNGPQGVIDNSTPIYEYDKMALSIYSDNKDTFLKFLSGIGIVSDGPVASRLQKSLRNYALMNAAVFGSEVKQKAEHSFFWPFC